jgi:hypothetical protein
MRNIHHLRVARMSLALLAALALALSLAALAAAQDAEPVIEKTSLRLWPEYDDPGLLVINAGEFTDTVTFPRDVAFPIPAGARQVQATVDDPSQGLLTRPFEVANDTLTYNLPLGAYHVEYYVDRAESGDQRAITYTFEAPYRTNALEVAIQQPARSTDFSVSPAPTGSYVGTDGFTYYTFTRENLAPGDEFDIVIRYTKTDNDLSTIGAAPALQPTPAPAPAAPSPGGAPDWLPWVLIIGGTVGIAGAIGYWLYQQRKQALSAPKPRAARPTVSAQPKPTTTTTAADGFCTQCGRALAPGDRFCAQCGAPRRR